MWPVSSGFVSQKFGRQNHPALKGVIVNNNGVNIQTQENEKVKTIFDGEVRRVAFIQGLGSTVIIKHGEYLTVYAGLKEVFVRSGQKVTTNQEIGKVFSNNEGVSELEISDLQEYDRSGPSGLAEKHVRPSGTFCSFSGPMFWPGIIVSSRRYRTSNIPFPFI